MKNYNSKEYQKNIDLYIYGFMDAEKAERFEKEIRENPDLEEEVQFKRLGQVSKFLSMKKQLKEVYRKENPFQWRLNPIYIRVAASIAIGLLGFAIWNYFSDDRDRQFAERQREQARLDSLNNRNIQNHVAISPTTSDLINASIADSKQQPQENIPKILEKAALAYERGNIAEASKLFEKPKPESNLNNNPNTYGSSPNNTTKQIETNPETESYRALYQGLIFLSNKQYKEAIIRFSKVEKPIQEEANWYAALAYLKNNELQKGTDLLQEIIKSKGKYQSDAENLLKSMQEVKTQK